MRSIIGNHVALVSTGRAGPDVMVGDAAMATDPPVSEKQRRAMYAAAEGKSNLGIPEKVGKEFVSKDEDKSMKKAMDAFPKAACDWLKGKMSEDDFKEFSAKDEWPDDDDKKAKDEKEDDKEKKAEDKAAEDKKAMDAKSAKDKAAKDKKAADKKAKDEEEEAEEVNEGEKDVKEHAEDKVMVSKGAMDAALKDRDASLKEQWRQEQREFRESEDLCRKKVGDFSTMAFDSTELLERHALRLLKNPDADTAPANGLKPLLRMYADVGAKPVDRGPLKLGMDAAVKADAKKYAPGIEHITIGV